MADEHGTARLQAIRLGWVDADEADVEPILRTAQADIRYVVGLYDALATREQTLRQALARYGRHDDNCARYQHDFRVKFRNTEPTCLCGYSAALAADAPAPEEHEHDENCWIACPHPTPPAPEETP